MKKRLAVLGVFLLIVIQLALPLSPALAQDPVHANADADLYVDMSISGLSAKYVSGLVLWEDHTGWSITIGGKNRRPQVGDKITVSGTVFSSFYARGRANSSEEYGNVAVAGAAGATGWLAGAVDPTDSLVALDGAAPAIAGAAAVAASDLMEDRVEIELAGALPIGGIANLAGALTVAAAPLGTKAEAETGAVLVDDTTMVRAESRSVVQKDGDVRVNAEVEGYSIQDFSFTLEIDRTGRWIIGSGALSAAIAGSALLDLSNGLDLVDYDYDWALRYFLCLLCFDATKYKPPVPVSEWKPVGEHIVFNGLPANARWGDLRRLEMNGVWTYVPPLKPADQLPSPVHADLMIHGYTPCTYVLRICDDHGSCQAPRYFTVKWTGSEGVQIYDYPSLPTTSPATATPSF